MFRHIVARVIWRDKKKKQLTVSAGCMQHYAKSCVEDGRGGGDTSRRARGRDGDMNAVKPPSRARAGSQSLRTPELTMPTAIRAPALTLSV